MRQIARRKYMLYAGTRYFAGLCAFCELYFNKRSVAPVDFYKGVDGFDYSGPVRPPASHSAGKCHYRRFIVLYGFHSELMIVAVGVGGIMFKVKDVFVFDIVYCCGDGKPVPGKAYLAAL